MLTAARVIADLVALGLPAGAVRIIGQIIEANVPARAMPRSLTDASGRTAIVLPPRDLSTVADVFRKRSIERTAMLGKLVNDAGWNMLLALFTAAERGERVNVTSLCYASGSPYTTALRHLDALEVMGLVKRSADPLDSRRSIVTATSDTLERMRSMILGFCVPPPQDIDAA